MGANYGILNLGKRTLELFMTLKEKVNLNEDRVSNAEAL